MRRRIAQDLSHPLLSTLQLECNRGTCPEMKAGEWLYLCVAHGTGATMEVSALCSLRQSVQISQHDAIPSNAALSIILYTLLTVLLLYSTLRKPSHLGESPLLHTILVSKAQDQICSLPQVSLSRTRHGVISCLWRVGSPGYLLMHITITGKHSRNAR